MFVVQCQEPLTNQGVDFVVRNIQYFEFAQVGIGS